MEPIPFACFERLMLADTRRNSPQHYFVRMELEGELHPREAEEAWKEASGRQPLLTSIARRRRPGALDWEWVASEPPQHPPVLWSDADESRLYARASFIDLEQEVGARLHIARRPGGAIVTFEGHHSCLDGRGTFQVLGDWLLAYGRRRGAPDHPLSVADVERLKTRSPFGQSTPMKRTKFFKVLPGFLKFADLRAAPLVPGAGVSQEEESETPNVVLHCFERSQTKALLAAAKGQGVSMGSLLARDLAAGLVRWRTENGYSRKRDLIRLEVPVDLRTEAEVGMPAANHLGLIALSFRGSECLDRSSLLQAAARGLRRGREQEDGVGSLWAMHLFGKTSLGLAKAMSEGNCVGTTMLTNAGRVLPDFPWRDDEGRITAGDATVTSLDFLGPLRANRHGVFSVSTYAGRLTIALRYDGRVLSESAARSLLDAVLAGCRESIADAVD